MKAILNNKLYDTEKADFIFSISVPQDIFHDDVNEFNVYRTKKEMFSQSTRVQNVLSVTVC